ncbi:hypothetical protein AVEN_40812-1 [Araneus ventricosus]|uniref:Uncharacterized protein n=1 Tax=Araneus ventricosus TaxID=182803 RepID=A0A4Y2CE96_ARAVE|nr:hypothetical protein AVEN_40812-1 [Araneus ventricosus]
MIAEEVGIGRETAHLKVTQDLGKRKLCYGLVPHTLTPKQMQLRLDTCGDLIDMADRLVPEVRHRRQASQYGVAGVQGPRKARRREVRTPASRQCSWCS